MASELIIKVDGDTSGLENKLKNAAGSGTRAFQKMGTAGVSSVNSITAAVGKLAKAVSGIAIAKKVAEIGKESIKLASDLTEVQNVIDVTFGEGNQKIESFAKNASAQFGMSELAAKQYTGTMGAMLKSMQVDDVEDMSTALVGLAGDMASFYNLDVDEAFSKIRSGISGETEPLKQLGINMSVANLEAFALSQGLDKSYQSMTQAEQATLRYNYLLSTTADAQGDFSRTSDSMANQLKIAQLNLENIKASLGQALLPAATAATTAFNNLLTNAQNTFPALKEAVAGAVDEIRTKLEEFGLFDALTSTFETLKSSLNEIIGTIITTFDSIVNSPAMTAIKETLSETFAGLSEQVGPAGELVKRGIQAIGDAIQSIVTALGTAWNFISPLIVGIIALADDIVAAVIGIKTTVANAWSEIFGLLGTAMTLLKGLFTGNEQMIETSVETIKTTIKNAFTKAYNSVCDIVNDLWIGVKDAFTKVKTTIEETFNIDLKATGQKIIESLKKGMDEKWQSVLQWFETKINDLLNKIPGKLKDFLGIDSVKLSDYSQSANYSTGMSEEEKRAMGYTARPDQSLSRTAKTSDESLIVQMDKKSIDDIEDVTKARSDEQMDYLGEFSNGVEQWFKDTEETTEKSLSGINTDMNDGFDSVASGGRSGTSSEYTALDEYNELQQQWQYNTDENGQWRADWSEGGTGQQLRDLVGEKLNGKYWGDLTSEDKAKLATMPARDGYTKGMYQTQPQQQTSTKASYSTAGMTPIGADGSVLGDLSVLAQGVTDEAIQSWLNLDAALQTILTTLNGGGMGEGGAEGGGMGLAAIFTTISDLLTTGIPAGIQTTSAALTETLPAAIGTALESLGQFTVGENGEIGAAGGNTLYTALGAIKGVFEDINNAIKLLIENLQNNLPPVVEEFKKTSGKLEGMLQDIATIAWNAAEACFALAQGIYEVIAAYEAADGVGFGKVPGGSGSGSGGSFLAAHGGQVRGVGLVGEQGPEIISTSRNMNVFTNRALQIAQSKVAGQLARTAYVGADSGSTSISNNNSKNASISIGTVLGADWVKSEVNQQIERIIRREMFYAS